MLQAKALLQAMLKHCLKQCSSMQKAYRVRVVRRTYGKHEQIMRGPSPKLGAVTGLILDGKICRWPGISGSGGLPIALASDETT
jgi:hypothetical protein